VKLGRALCCCGLLNLACDYGVSELKISPDAPDWSCIGQGTPLLTNELLDISLPIKELGNDQPLDGVTATFCDAVCDPPVATATSVDGMLRFSGIDPNQRGYIELEAPGLMPTLVNLLRPIGSMPKLPELRMFDPRALALFAGELNQTINPESGEVLYWAEDCTGKPVAGVALQALDEMADDTVSYYAADPQTPSTSLKSTAKQGGGGIINVPPGFPLFRAVRVEDGVTLSEFPVHVLAGTATLFVAIPE